MTAARVGRRRITLLATGTVLTLSSLSGCGTKAGDLAPQPIHKGDQYVALGDSYTAAPRTGPPAADDGCLQTTVNYPRLVAKRLDLELTDASCGGASTVQVTEAQPLGPHRAPPQKDALTGATDLVTISLGANDFNTFGAVLFFCPALRAKDPTGAPCTKATDAAGQNSLEQRIAQIANRLVAVIRLVKQRAPDARIVVVGYPQFFPKAGPCAQLPLAAGDYALARRVNVLLVAAQKKAAERTKVEYLDVFTATKGHDMCADVPWIAGVTLTRTDAQVYHPYPEEQRAVADLLVDLLS